METSIQTVLHKIGDYKKKYYQNQLIKGLLISTGLILGAFLFVNFLEFFGRFNSTFRIILLVSFLGLFLYSFVQYIAKPSYYLLNSNKVLSDEDAAKQIGVFFPDIKDKLLNTLQLANINSVDNSLLEASIAQKTQELKFIHFTDAIQLNQNKKYLKYAIPPLVLILLISAIAPKFFNSTERIVKFNKTFADPAPFQFEIQNKDLKAVKNEDFNLKLNLLGNSLPEEVFLVSNGRKYKMHFDENNNFEYTFSKIQEATEFHFIAGGYTSNSFKIELIARPNLLSFNVNLKYPDYLGKPSENFENVGNLVIPEGTIVKWNFKTNETDNFKMIFDSSSTFKVEKGMFTDFNFQKKINKTTSYEIHLENKNSNNADPINYFINVIEDKYPQINFEQISDSSLYNYIGIGGTISDDYGITDFKFAYKKKNQKEYAYLNIPFNKNSISQTFFYQIDINSLNLSKNDEIEYLLILTDNDGVNGRKSTKTPLLTFNMPTNKEFEIEISNEINKTEEQFEDILKQTKEYKKGLEQLESSIKKKNEVNFQDKKEMEKLQNQKEKLNKELNKLQEQLQKLKEKQNRFDQINPKTQEKMDMIQNMINELMKNEDSKILEDLKKLLENKLDDKSLNNLEKFNKQQRNLDKELDRTLNLFKDLQRKQKIEETIKDLLDLAEKQEKLADTPDSDSKDQKELAKEFKEKSKKLDEIEKDSKELKKDFDKQDSERKEIQQEQNKASESLDKKDQKGAKEAQKKAAKKMKQMAEQMQQQMQGAEQQQMEEDMNSMRAVMENLIKISHDQERIMKNFKTMSVSDPRFVAFSQNQLNISNDAKIIEDSLYALASRVMQLEAGITKEVTLMKNHIDKSVKLIKERKLPQAASSQQFSMTSMNNLALMLSDIFQNMQQEMNPSSGSGKGKSGKGEGGDAGEKQKQLNKRIEGIGSQGKTPREISEEIGKIINEQAQIRKQLKDLQENLNGTELGKKIGNELQELQKEMDKTEEDLANKKINSTLKNRQKNIETRLLEAEKAIKEQELDPTRKGKTATQINKTTPPELEKFKKEKEKQVELIRTTPHNFTPFYKKETDNYFKRIN